MKKVFVANDVKMVGVKYTKYILDYLVEEYQIPRAA